MRTLRLLRLRIEIPFRNKVVQGILAFLRKQIRFLRELANMLLRLLVTLANCI